MNRVILTGRLTRDVELRYTAQGMAVANFTLAVDRVKKDDERKADFPRVTVFGKTAENVERYLSKGSLVGIEGSITTGQYTDKNGSVIYTTDVIADRVEFLEKRRTDEQAGGIDF